MLASHSRVSRGPGEQKCLCLQDSLLPSLKQQIVFVLPHPYTSLELSADPCCPKSSPKFLFLSSKTAHDLSHGALSASRPPATQADLHIIAQFSDWGSPPLTDPNLGSSEAQHIPPLLPLPHAHSSLLGPEKQCHTSHMGSSTHCKLCVTIIPVPTGPSPGPGAQRTLSICKLAAGSMQPHLQAALFLSQPFQFLSLSTAFTPHAFNSSQVARGKDT